MVINSSRRKKIFLASLQVLHNWKNDSSVPMQVLREELPDVLTDVLVHQFQPVKYMFSVMLSIQQGDIDSKTKNV